MKFNIALLLCWLGIHRYRIINSTFGFGPGGTVERVQCKFVESRKLEKDKNLMFKLWRVLINR